MIKKGETVVYYFELFPTAMAEKVSAALLKARLKNQIFHSGEKVMFSEKYRFTTIGENRCGILTRIKTPASLDKLHRVINRV